jgi:hypothetical protein
MITGPITYSLYYVREGLDHLSDNEISTDINSISTSLININDMLQTIDIDSSLINNVLLILNDTLFKLSLLNTNRDVQVYNPV